MSPESVVGMLNNTRLFSASFLPLHPRSLQSPQWLHISYVLPVFWFVLITHSSSTLKANIFGTEQDRVNCSFYYKVCGFYAENVTR